LNRFSATSVLAVCTMASSNVHAAPNEGPTSGYYRIEQFTRLRPPPSPVTPQVEVTMTNQDGVLTREDRAPAGVVSQQQFASQPDFQCVTKTDAAADWSKVLLDICKAGGGSLCEGEQSLRGVRTRALGQDVWEVSYPVQLDRGGPNAVSQLQSAMSDPRTLQGMSPAEREKARAGMAQLPSSAEIASAYERSARIAEESAAKEKGPGAQRLREASQRLRAGHAGGMQGESVERWVRVADSCPAK
jgi:hypothetical protein